MNWNLLAIPLLARVSLVILFPFSGLDKIVHWNAALKQANSSPIGGGGFLLVAAIIIEFVTPLCIVLGWYERVAALILAAFCVATAILYHPFWKFPGFWSGKNPEGLSHFWDFLKNFGLVGGLLLVVIGGTAIPANTLVHRSLSPAPPFSAPTPSPRPQHQAR